MLGQEDFRPVTLADRAFFERHYALYPQTHSDNTFTNMVCWNHFAQYRYAYVNGNVILASTIAGVTRFRPPIGPRDPALMKALIRFAMDIGDDIPIVLIDPATAQWMRELDPTLTLVPDRNHSSTCTGLWTLPSSRERTTSRSAARSTNSGRTAVTRSSRSRPPTGKK